MRTPTLWEQTLQRNPNHSLWYVERMRALAAEGNDLAGEARLLDAMVPRGARVLDAGCGPGRVGAALAALGHTVVGIDVDPVLINAAIEILVWTTSTPPPTPPPRARLCASR